MSQQVIKGRSLRTLILLSFSVAAAALVYGSLIKTFFYSDDWINLYDLATEPLARFVLVPFNGHLQIVRNLIFAGMRAIFGLDARGYFVVVVLIHLACVALLFNVINNFTADASLAFAGAFLWGTAPVQEGTIGWLAVYGHALVAFGLLGFLTYLGNVKSRGRPTGWGIKTLWATLLLAVSACFGIGIAVALMAPVIAFLILPPGVERRRMCAVLAVLWIAVPAAYLLARRMGCEQLYAHGPAQCGGSGVVDSWPLDTFTLSLTAKFFAAGVRAVHLGMWATPIGRAWPARVVGVIFLLAVAVALARGTREGRRLLLALALTALGSYGIVAIGHRGEKATTLDTALRAIIALRGGSGSGVPFSVEDYIAETSRYHYAATACLVAMSCVAVSIVTARWHVTRAGANLFLAALVAFTLGGWWYTGWHPDHFDKIRVNVTENLKKIEASVAMTPPGQPVVILNRSIILSDMFSPEATAFPGLAGLFVVVHPENVVDGKPIFFVEPDAKVIAAASQRPRMRALLLPDGVGGLTTPLAVPRIAPAP
jgi:hypothetical protein